MPETLHHSLTIALGREFAWRPTALGVSGPWESTGDLPGGLSLSATTGELSGVPTAAGDFSFSIANEGGDVTVTFSLTVGTDPGDDEDVSVPLDFDLDYGIVTRPGQKEPARIFLGKIGDKRPVAIGFHRAGALKKVTPTSLKIGVKEFEPERLYPLNGDGSGFELVETASGFRVKTVIEYLRADLARLGRDYEGDFVSGTVVPCEIELTTNATLNTLPPASTPLPVVVTATVNLTSHSGVMHDTDNLVFALPAGAGTYRFSANFVHATFGKEWSWVDTVVDDGAGNLSVPNPVYLPGRLESRVRVDYPSEGGWIETMIQRSTVTGGAGQITLQMVSSYTGYRTSFPTITGPLQVTAEMIAAPPVGVSPYDSSPGQFRVSSRSFELIIERDLQPE